MGTRRKLKLFAALAFFSATSALLFPLEFQAVGIAHMNSLGQQNRIVPLAKLPFSHRARLDILRRCERELSAPLSLVKTGHSLMQDANRCLAIARATKAKMPSFGLAFLVVAKSHWQLGQPELARAALTMSVAVAPYEGWQIQRRLKLAMELSAPADQITKVITVLLATQSGAALVALYYIKDVEIRRFVDESLRTVAKTDQKRFSNLLRRTLARS